MPGVARLSTHFSFQTQGHRQGSEPAPDAALSIQEGDAGTVQIGTGLTDQTIMPAWMTTVTGLELWSDQDISLKLGATGSNVAFTVSANMPVSMLGVSLSAVTVSNSSGSTANIQRKIVGS